MAGKIGIGNQDFATIRKEGCFYIDKTYFIRDWWESGDNVTLITRPRRFGKTLNMSMLDYFFSVKHAGKSELFEGLSIWEDETYRNLQGTYPVISLSFANVKESDYRGARQSLNRIIEDVYNKNIFLLDSNLLSENEKDYFRSVTIDPDGVQLSGGESQRLAFSRTLYRDKPLMLVLDEPSAALDPLAEAALYQDFLTFCGNRAALFISHRLASVSVCERIILLKDGEVLETGTHTELMAKNGEYAELYRIQSEFYHSCRGSVK